MQFVKFLKCKKKILKKTFFIQRALSRLNVEEIKNSKTVLDFEDSGPETENQGKRGSIFWPKPLQNILY